MEFPSPTYEFTLWLIFRPSFAKKTVFCHVRIFSLWYKKKRRRKQGISTGNRLLKETNMATKIPRDFS